MYGNYFTPGYQLSYQPNYYPMNGAMPDQLSQLRNQQMQPPQVPQCSCGIIWVLGEAEAKSYPVAPGNTVILWDKDNPTIFIKSADASGVPSLRILDWVERRQPSTPAQSTQNNANNPTPDYVTRKEFDERMAKFEAITANAKEESENG